MNNPYGQDPRDGHQHDDQAQYSTYGGDRPKNTMGIVGFVLSITCLLAPIGLLVSLIALFKRPRGFAIAGTLVGLVFSAVLLLGGGGVIAAMTFARGGMAVGVMAIQSETLEQQIMAYQSETGSLPSSLDQVNLPAAAKVDPWGIDYRFNPDVPREGAWTISSAGPDGQFGTGDDIDSVLSFARNPPDDVMEEWMKAAQRDKDKWPGFWDTIQLGSEMGTWQQNNAGSSAVAGGGSPDAIEDPDAEDPADTPESP